MKILEYLIYGYFWIQLFRWCLTFLVLWSRNPVDKIMKPVKIKFKFVDNIIWIAPTIYFAGGLT